MLHPAEFGIANQAYRYGRSTDHLMKRTQKVAIGRYKSTAGLLPIFGVHGKCSIKFYFGRIVVLIIELDRDPNFISHPDYTASHLFARASAYTLGRSLSIADVG
jgi:hypothetical protein